MSHFRQCLICKQWFNYKETRVDPWTARKRGPIKCCCISHSNILHDIRHKSRHYMIMTYMKEPFFQYIMELFEEFVEKRKEYLRNYTARHEPRHDNYQKYRETHRRNQRAKYKRWKAGQIAMIIRWD